MTFDPECDDPDLLRIVVQLLRASAIAANARQDGAEIRTEEEKVSEALTMLTKIDDIKKVAGNMRQAVKIEQGSDDVRTALSRLLTQAQSALSAAAADNAA